MDDVRFLGGHGTNGPDGKRVSPYSANLASDPDPHRRWDGQFPSLWVTHGGGGTFANIWTPDTFAQAGMYISDTTTPGRVYELSSEHHVRNEIKLDQVANWELYALQTEGEREESASALSLEISRSKNITIANYHGYRVVRSYHPVPYAIRIFESTDIRFRNVHVDSNSAMSSVRRSGLPPVHKVEQGLFRKLHFRRDAPRGGEGPRVRMAGCLRRSRPGKASRSHPPCSNREPR